MAPAYRRGLHAASILSGRLPHLVNEQNREVWQAGGGVDLRMELLPAKLKAAGFISHQLGKWHAGMSSAAHMPTSRGFASSFGYLGGAEDHWTQRQGPGVDFWEGGPARTKNGTLFGDEHFAAAATEIISAHDFGEAKLFLYLALQVVHEPVEAPEQYLARYPDIEFSTRRTQNAMSSVMDSAVKNTTDALRTRGVYNSTLIFFTADKSAQ
eukprot:COSAG04_NODE_3776_length_2539_cov_1.580738_2_plen_211_part_00